MKTFQQVMDEIDALWAPLREMPSTNTDLKEREKVVRMTIQAEKEIMDDFQAQYIRRKELRPVKTKTWMPTPKPGRWSNDFNKKGLFHKWGYAYEEFESGPGNYTVAIVEFPDGHVEEIPVPMVIFVPPSK